MTEFNRDNNSVEFINDNPDFELFHATPNDSYCDLLLLVSNPENDLKIMIPTNKTVMVANLKYFECMFREGSNWKENKDISYVDDTKNTTGISKEPDTKQTKLSINPIKVNILTPHVRAFAEYIRSIYAKKLDLTPNNCHLYYNISDFLQDDQGLKIINKYIITNICYENIIEIMKQTDKFDEPILNFLTTKLVKSDDQLESFCKKSIDLDTNRFAKLVIVLEQTYGRNWIEMLCSYRCLTGQGSSIASDILENLITDRQYQMISKLRAIIELAEKGTGIELSISTLRGEYGILVKKKSLVTSDINICSYVHSHGHIFFSKMGTFFQNLHFA